MGPWMLSAGDRACRGARCVRQALDRFFNASDLRFPGFFVHRFDASALLPPYVSGVPDNTWVEVLRAQTIPCVREGHCEGEQGPGPERGAPADAHVPWRRQKE